METENVTNENVETETTTTPEVETNSEKTFTQEEVNAIVKERLAKVNKGIPSKEELTKFNEWKESQKSQEEKMSDIMQKAKDNETIISNLKMQNEVLKAGVTDNDDIDYIIYKVGKMDGEFADNLKEYLTDNPKFVSKKQEKATGFENKSSVAKEDGVMAILKSKHPDLF